MMSLLNGFFSLFRRRRLPIVNELHATSGSLATADVELDGEEFWQTPSMLHFASHNRTSLHRINS